MHHILLSNIPACKYLANISRKKYFKYEIVRWKLSSSNILRFLFRLTFERLGSIAQKLYWKSRNLEKNGHNFMFSIAAHCSKSSFFVQKLNFDFPWKLSIFWVKNSWKCSGCSFGLFNCWQLWFHEKNCEKKILGEKLVKLFGICTF